MAESEASLDEQLELKKRARRRLVGATALALLAAIVLPMVMDHEPRPANQDIQVRIPSADSGGGFAARVLPAKSAATPLPPVVPVAEVRPAPERAAETKPETKPEAKAEAPAAKVAAVPAPVATATKPVEMPTEKAVTKSADKATDKKSEENRAAETLDGHAEQWVIQLGAYKDAGNVKLLLSKLKGIGVPAYTEKFDSPQGPRTRVRAGPYPSKDAAEKARTKVKIVGVDGPVAPK